MPYKQSATRDGVQDADHRAPDGVDDLLRGLDRAQEIVAGMEREIGSVPLRERRSGKRTHTTYRLVSIECNGDQGLACCRNISDTGIKLELSMPVEIGQRIEVVFSPRQCCVRLGRQDRGKQLWNRVRYRSGQRCSVEGVDR